MCLIIASQSALPPDMDIVRAAIMDNPHGWGTVYANKHGLRVEHGFGLDGLTRAIKRLGGPYLIHFRYATHGAVGIANCHPFRVNADCYMVHNGVLRIPIIDQRYSDSWHFARNYVRPYVATRGYSALVADTEHFIGAWNKVAYIQRDGEISIANEAAGTWRGGLWYSNDYSFPVFEKWGSLAGSRDAISADNADKPEFIVLDSESECDYCGDLTRELCFDADTKWYLCRDCAATFACEELLDEELLNE